MNPSDRTYGELTKLLREANPLIFADLETGTVFNEDLIEFECERVAALTDPPGDPPITVDEYRRAGLLEVERLRGFRGPNFDAPFGA
jgi:hypothetical protein